MSNVSRSQIEKNFQNERAKASFMFSRGFSLSIVSTGADFTMKSPKDFCIFASENWEYLNWPIAYCAGPFSLESFIGEELFEDRLFHFYAVTNPILKRSPHAPQFRHTGQVVYALFYEKLLLGEI